MVLSNKISKKKLIIILALIELCTLFLVSKSLSNKSYALDDVNILNQKFKDGNMFAIYINNGEEYERVSSNDFFIGTNYYLNKNLTGCVDADGHQLDDIYFHYDEYDDGKVTVKYQKTMYCFLYFDIKENLLVDVLKNSPIKAEYRGEGYYHDENDKDTTNPFFTRPIYYWNGTTTANEETILDSWNVVFAGQCWKMIRTTDNDGVKLLYNGVPDIGESELTGDITYDCSNNRLSTNASINNHIDGYSFRNHQTECFYGSYYYGLSYVYDRNTNKFILADIDDNPSIINSSTIDNLIGKYTCKSISASGTCDVLYYINSYSSEHCADTKQLTSYSTREGIATVNSWTGAGSYVTGSNALTSFGFMGIRDYEIIGNEVAGRVYESLSFKSIESSTQTITTTSGISTKKLGPAVPWNYLTSGGSNTYFSNSYTINESNRYLLENPETGNTLKGTDNDYSCLLGMYTGLSTSNSSNGTTNIYYVVGISGDYVFYIKVTDNTILPTFYTITPSNDQVRVQEKASAGTIVSIVSNVSGYKLYSFKYNGTDVIGDSFTMPNGNVTLTDFKFIQAADIIETSTHNPFPSTTGTTTYYENTFSNATSIKVKLTYQTYSTNTTYSYVRLYQTDSSTEFGTYANGTTTSTILTIPGNYIKIDWYNKYGSSSYINKYGFKAEIYPQPDSISNSLTINDVGDGSGTLTDSLVYSDNTYLIIGESITDNDDGTYTLNNITNVKLDDWILNYANYTNHYICFDTISTICSYSETTLITSTTLNSISFRRSNISKLYVASSVSLSGNNYVMTNPVLLKTIDNQSINWINNYANYTHYYICPDYSTSCSVNDMRNMSSITIDKYTYWPMYLYSNSYTYENGTYTLDMNNQYAISHGYLARNINDLGKAHYTCYNATGVCDNIYYVYYAESNTTTRRTEFAASLKDGMYVSTDSSNINEYYNDNNYIYKSLYSENVNDYSSGKKAILDNWYGHFILNHGYDKLIDRDEIYCNDRRIINYNSWNYGSDIGSELLFKQSTTDGNINCPVKNDAFSANETIYGNGDLTYPVGILSAPEMYILTGSTAASQLRSVSMIQTTLSPSDISGTSPRMVSLDTNGALISYYANSANSGVILSPSISLREGIQYTRGTGTQIDPYVVEAGGGYDIMVNNSDYHTTRTKANKGQIISIYFNNNKNIFQVTSFKLNGELITGNTFRMPDNDAKITDIQSTQLLYYITNSNNNIQVQNLAEPGETIVLRASNKITSFRLNGELITGNTFTMPSTNVTITNVEITQLYNSMITYYSNGYYGNRVVSTKDNYEFDNSTEMWKIKEDYSINPNTWRYYIGEFNLNSGCYTLYYNLLNVSSITGITFGNRNFRLFELPVGASVSADTTVMVTETSINSSGKSGNVEFCTDGSNNYRVSLSFRGSSATSSLTEIFDYYVVKTS